MEPYGALGLRGRTCAPGRRGCIWLVPPACSLNGFPRLPAKMPRRKKLPPHVSLKAGVTINTLPAPEDLSVPFGHGAQPVVVDKARLSDLLKERDDLLQKYNEAAKRVVLLNNTLCEDAKLKKLQWDRRQTMLGPKPVNDEIVTSFCSRMAICGGSEMKASRLSIWTSNWHPPAVRISAARVSNTAVDGGKHQPSAGGTAF